jgi:hypothetical protein
MSFCANFWSWMNLFCPCKKFVCAISCGDLFARDGLNWHSLNLNPVMG